MKRSELIFNAFLVPVDFLMLVLAGLATYILRTKILDVFRPVLFEFNLPLGRFIILVIFVSLFFIGVYAISGLYAMRVHRSMMEEFFKVVIASSAGILGVIIFIFLRQELFNSRFLVLGAWVFSLIFVTLGRFLMKALQKRIKLGEERLLIIGNDEISEKIKTAVKFNPLSGYRIVKELANPEVAEVKTAISNPGVDEVILANPNYPSEKVSEIVDFCNENHLTFRYVPNIHQILTANFAFDIFTGVPLIELRRTALDGWGRITKRIIDIVVSSVGLVILSPLFLIVAFLIKWDSEGPVFARLRRISRNKEFNLYKFRSMIKDAEKFKQNLLPFNERKDSPLFKMRYDPRVTKVGRFLRRYRLDELPQLWDVLKGDISLVGPRPHQPDEIEKYEKHHKKVLAIKSGATGLAQISGSSDLPFEEEVKLDTFYIEDWSLSLDIKIILKTVLKLLKDRSAV